MAMEHEQSTANIADVSETSQYHTSTESLYYTSIAESKPYNAPIDARAFPMALKEYQSEDIKEVQREGQVVRIVERGQGTRIGAGGQAEAIFEVMVDTGVEHGGQKPELFTYVAKTFKGLSTDSHYGQWQEQAHGLAAYYGGFICQFYGYCRNYEGSFCLLMRKYDSSLRTVMDEEMKRKNYSGRPLLPGVAVNMICQVAIGMAIVHRESIVHRDLKAANIFVYKDGSDNMPWGAYIGDFDIGDNTEGSAYWRAPEILEAVVKRRLDGKTKLPWTPMADVYSFGVTCYEILTGDIPLKDHPRADYAGVYEGGIRPVLPAELNPVIKDLIVRCWHRDPLQRPTSDAIVSELKEMMKEFREFLEMFEKGEKLPLSRRPTTEECLSRLEHVFQDLRSKYPVEVFVQPGEVDFVKLGFHILKCMKRFVRKFGYKPYIDHPCLPWSLYFARFKSYEKLWRVSIELDQALPWLQEQLVISTLKMYIFDGIFEGKEDGDSWIAEGGIDAIQMSANQKSWLENVGKRPKLISRHYGCIHKHNYGHYGGDKDYPICDYCKDEKPKVEIVPKPTFRVFHEEFASDA